jgi:alkylated DNA nucleotide flippase Atl1
MSGKRSWREKLADSKDLPKVVTLRGKAAAKWGQGTMAIPAPIEVDQIMRSVPRGRVLTTDVMRAFIARKHRASVGCPLTTGIFAWISANAAEEAATEGEQDTTPYWRTLKKGGELNAKFPGGIEAQKARLKAEGHCIETKGKKIVVSNHEAVLFQPGK